MKEHELLITVLMIILVGMLGVVMFFYGTIWQCKDLGYAPYRSDDTWVGFECKAKQSINLPNITLGYITIGGEIGKGIS